jgi:hypothetical protein
MAYSGGWISGFQQGYLYGSPGTAWQDSVTGDPLHAYRVMTSDWIAVPDWVKSASSVTLKVDNIEGAAPPTEGLMLGNKKVIGLRLGSAIVDAAALGDALVFAEGEQKEYFWCAVPAGEGYTAPSTPVSWQTDFNADGESFDIYGSGDDLSQMKYFKLILACSESFPSNIPISVDEMVRLRWQLQSASIPTTLTIPASHFEQGTISGHGDGGSTSRIRTIYYYELPSGNTGTVTATVDTSLSYAFSFCVQLYKSDKTTDSAYESAWVNCGMPLDLSSFPADSVYIRFVLRDNRTITPSDITSMTYTFSSSVS